MRIVLVRSFWMFGLTGAVILVLAWYDQPDRGSLRILFLDTPGDAILIQTPRGEYLLIDGGEDGTRLSQLLGRYLPFWYRTLDAVVLTRLDRARLPGQVAALSRYRVRQALAPASPLLGSPADPMIIAYWSEWQRLLADVPLYQFDSMGDAPVLLDLGGARGTLWPMGPEQGPMILVEYGNSRVMLNGGGGDSPYTSQQSPTSLHLLAYPWEEPLPIWTLEHERPMAIVFLPGKQRDPPALLTYHERAYHGAIVFHPMLDGSIEFVSNGHMAWITKQHH